MCGEKRFPAQGWRCKVGSPPHVRGKDVQLAFSPAGTGITPACAGKRFGFVVIDNAKRDHPRMCGEKTEMPSCFRRAIGSPPHVRGKVLRAGTGRRRDGITPACAGKRIRGLHRKTAAQDHPRMCGEKHNHSYQQGLERGSPPHVRGKDVQRNAEGQEHRITPACAGKRTIL